MRWLRSILVALIPVSLATSPALAGPIEQFVQVAIHPADADVIVLRYEAGGDGFFYSNDGGKSFKMLCASAIAPGTSKSGPSILTGDGRVLMGLFDGMWQGDSQGCAWSRVSDFEGRWVSDFAAHPTDPMVTFGTSSKNGKDGRIVRRGADGSWTEMGDPEDLIVFGLAVGGGASGARLYASVVKAEDSAAADGGVSEPRNALRVSDDEGATWREVPLEMPGTLRLEAVDPSNPDRIVIVARGGNAGDQIWVSVDAGSSFREYVTLTAFGGLAFAPDGRVWIADAGDGANLQKPKGIWRAQSLAEPPATLTTEQGMFCVAYQASTDRLFACPRFKLGNVDQETGAFTTLVDMATVNDFVSCEGRDMASVCETQLCNALCGPGHFAQAAPICTAYNTPTCGPCADGPQSPACLAWNGGGPSAAGTSGAQGGGGRTANADAGMPTGAKPASSGCATAPSATGVAWASLSVWTMILLTLLRRTRRPMYSSGKLAIRRNGAAQ